MGETPQSDTLVVLSSVSDEPFASALREACRLAGCRALREIGDTPRELVDSVASASTVARLLVVAPASWLRDTGLDLLTRLRTINHEARVLLVGGRLDSLTLGHAARLGLRGMAPREIEADRLARAIEAIASGELWISRQQLLEAIMLLGPPEADSASATWDHLPSLTGRENDVLEQVLEGKANKSIGRALGISERTVKIHLQSIYRKLGVHRRVELIKAHVNGHVAD